MLGKYLQIAASGGEYNFNPLGILPGASLQGGYFAGYISRNGRGVPTHALIVAPAATGATGTGYTTTTNLQWQSTNAITATDSFDGASNTVLIQNSPAANFCKGLTIGGYSDWYLPARYELEIAYFNLKPFAVNNNTSWGINPFSSPKRLSNYTTSNPSQTSVASFQSGGAEAFSTRFHWSSTENLLTTAWGINFYDGSMFSTSKNSGECVRAFRKLTL